MGVFDDKKFEELDWVSQAIEPIDSEMNEYLGKLPDEVSIDFETYIKMIGDSYGADVSLDRAVEHLMQKHCSNCQLSWDQKDELVKCFAFEMSGEPIINFVDKTISGGELKLIKTASTLDEKVLEKLLGREGIQAVRNNYMPEDGIGRANEIMEILGGCEGGLRTRSIRRKRAALHDRLVKLFKDNEWNIKDTTLANKVGFWICSYVKEGNLAAFSNFCRLKVMTHKGQPIYSMEEVQ